MFDLYQFLFTGIDIEVRTRFMADFVCSVYYDNFAKTVATINTNVSMFSLAEFIREFNDKIEGKKYGGEEESGTGSQWEMGRNSNSLRDRE